MTAHEVYTSLLWIVAGGYLIYVGWFAFSATRSRRSPRPRLGDDDG